VLPVFTQIRGNYSLACMSAMRSPPKIDPINSD
jgi:hypothetical protein